MEATIAQDTPKHYPVLLKEIISIITPQYGGTFIDCTFGQGGYTKKILEFKDTKVIALDRDIRSEIIAKRIQKKFPQRLLFKNLTFGKLNNLKIKNESIKGIVFDLGYSLNQIKDPLKGLSFSYSGKLNMRMGLNDFSASDVINKLEDNELEKIFKYFGDERQAKQISKKIINERKEKEIDTENLVRIIEETKKRKNFKIHNATKIFQSLRILVNKEISELIYGLINSAKILKKDGVLAVVTFHSLEDKIVKYFFKSLSEDKSVSRYSPKIEQSEKFFDMPIKKPIVPSNTELTENPPSRSGKLRYIIKKKNIYEIKSDILEKFNYLIKIENLGSKL